MKLSTYIKSMEIKNNEKIIKKALIELDINFDMETDPQIMKKIIHNMKLDDFSSKNESINKYLAEIQKTPQSLSQTLQDIKDALLEKHPAIIEFLEIALSKKWLKKSRYVNESIHFIFAQEFLTSTMLNDHNFFCEIHKHFLSERNNCGIKRNNAFSTFLKTFWHTKSFFLAIKILSIDLPVQRFKLLKSFYGFSPTEDFIKKNYKDNKINYIEYKSMLTTKIKKSNTGLFRWLSINIREAGILEYKKKLKDNAFCSLVLSEIVLEQTRKIAKIEKLIKKTSSSEKEFFDNYELIISKSKDNSHFFSQKWNSLYTSWNLAFVLWHFNDLHIVLPKLLIPSLLKAKKNSFMNTRTISLWISFNVFLFKKINNQEAIKGPSNKKEMAKTFGKINKKYAIKLLEDNNIKKKNFTNTFKKRSNWSYLDLFKKAYESIMCK